MFRSNFMEGVTRYWWLPLVSGLVCLGFGLWSIFAPASALPFMAAVFAYGLLFVGVFEGAWAVSTVRHNAGWGWDILVAAVDIIAGIWMLTMSQANMTVTFLYIVGFWMILSAFNGIGQLFAVANRSAGATFVATVLLVVTLIASIWLIINPIGLGITAWIMVGIALVCYGIFKIEFALKIRRYAGA